VTSKPDNVCLGTKKRDNGVKGFHNYLNQVTSLKQFLTLVPVLRARVWSEVCHNGLDESTNDADDPDNGVRVGLQQVGIKRFTPPLSQDDEESCEGDYDSQTHATLVKSEPEVLLQRLDRFPSLFVIPEV